MNELSNLQLPMSSRCLAHDIRKKHALLNKAGHYVYKYVLAGEVIYVGRTDGGLVNHLKRHRCTGNSIVASLPDAQAKVALDEINRAQIYYCQTDSSAQNTLIVSELIRRYKPRYNKGAVDTQQSDMSFLEPNWIFYERLPKRVIGKAVEKPPIPKRLICPVDYMIKDSMSLLVYLYVTDKINSGKASARVTNRKRLEYVFLAEEIFQDCSYWDFDVFCRRDGRLNMPYYWEETDDGKRNLVFEDSLFSSYDERRFWCLIFEQKMQYDQERNLRKRRAT